MRLVGNEAQVTQAVASVAGSDPKFAAAFVKLLLDVARDDVKYRPKVERLGNPPDSLDCRAEESVYDEYDQGLGRIDLRFDGSDDFTLFVENKLHSGFGPEQLKRYKAALDLLPEERARRGLIAVTRDVPSYGELDASEEGWLGAVRWARLYDRGLGQLPIADPDVALQWRLLIDVLHDQGDLGLTTVNQDLILAWARFGEARSHLVDILGDVRQRALDILRAELRKKHRTGLDHENIASAHKFGTREAVAVKRDLYSVWTGFRVPARSNRPAVRIMFFYDDAKPLFAVEVAPWRAESRLDENDTRLLASVRKLTKAGFKDAYYKGESVWFHEHDAASFLSSPDVPQRLIELIETDIATIVGSGILAFDLEVAARGGRAAPPRVKT